MIGPPDDVSQFRFCVEFMLLHEGITSDLWGDPGGPTKWGIASERNPDIDDVYKLTRDDAITIYKRRYWDVCKCDELPIGIDLMVFDCGVNQGTDRAIKFLQDALRVHVDGVVGPITIAAARDAKRDDIIWELGERRAAAYLTTAALYQRPFPGWGRRLMQTTRAALALAMPERYA